MLIACDENNQLVSLMSESEELIEKIRGSKLYCVSCGEQVRLKNGQRKIAHFAHISKKTCDSFSEGETEEHLFLKQALASWCERDGLDYEIEAYLPELNQRPDILIGKLALEVQCSSISKDRLLQRTRNYLEAGYYPIWICGEKLAPKNKIKEVARSLCYFSENSGFYLWSIDWREKELAIQFHLEEQWNRQLHSVTKKWCFSSESLLQIFSFPEKRLFFHQRKHNTRELVQAYYQDLNKKLVTKDRCILEVQATLYNKGFHLLHLPYWFYYPGIRLFCCKQSDIFVKQKFFELVQFYGKEGICSEALFILAVNELEKADIYLIIFPNVSKKILIQQCVRELFHWLKVCQLIKKIENKWYYNHNIISDQTISFGNWHSQLGNKYLISATPIENMIL
ncbi:competence protein CoiA [Enterococcus rivorum]|uniref:Competence protein CoiA n=1 Tax=Enterococcus rivorum TaxID=762845 RepID=A0A1E5KZV1_9ENTE|nr:competence protein CoiA family protein [Enterococcus rivorum]MBP2099265.1 competence protein CoiA [Enterococcus rivorum]OEH83355.1 hypothetical protein BCR26_09855 [Enterococcus rivorum]